MQILDLNSELETLPDRVAARVQAGLVINVPFFFGSFDFSDETSMSVSSRHSSAGALDGISLSAPYFRLFDSILSFPGGFVAL